MAGRLGVVASNATRTAINPQRGRATRARESGFKRLIQKQARSRANSQAGRAARVREPARMRAVASERMRGMRRGLTPRTRR